MTKFDKLFSYMSRDDKEEIGRIVCSHVQCAECPLRKVCYGCLDDRGEEIGCHDDIYVHLAEWAMAEPHTKDTMSARCATGESTLETICSSAVALVFLITIALIMCGGACLSIIAMLKIVSRIWSIEI